MHLLSVYLEFKSKGKGSEVREIEPINGVGEPENELGLRYL